ncbi:hypothetical protein PanWU01x14_044520 [Parasponia andersonii]|uniref:Uncharacterized protein n=1 Tax=Parasponia andersonii TaxID=3476 RepID=A0A2P5DP95_PARAD|nr:hypothetical protein PanWU01x14_044520 [Parasponia andersonii]
MPAAASPLPIIVEARRHPEMKHCRWTKLLPPELAASADFGHCSPRNWSPWTRLLTSSLVVGTSCLNFAPFEFNFVRDFDEVDWLKW